MNVHRPRRRAVGWLVLLALLGVGAPAPAWAQDSSPWSFVVTPQAWLSRIEKNGFANPPNGGTVGGFAILERNGDFVPNPFGSDSSPKNDVNPQWGLQVAAQKDRLTLAGAFQFVDFTTYNDLTYVHPQGLSLCFGLPISSCLPSGQRWAREAVDTTRIDMDFAATYFFPDVIRDWVDASAGAGFKFIYASAKRRHSRLSGPAALLESGPPRGSSQTVGIYTTCGDPCSPPVFRNEVKEKSYLYGLIFPMNATLHLTRDARWLLGLSVSPMIGGETRDDYDVVYSQILPKNVTQLQPPIPVERLDGTTLAYGVTADASVRWIISETLSAYVGMRVQYIKGHETYLAYGPLIGMSFRFGTR